MKTVRECVARRVLARIMFGFSLASAAGGAWAEAVVDEALPPVNPEDWVRGPRRQPVQLLFEFQTNGAANPEGTELLRRRVFETVRGSRVFSRIGEGAVPGGATLNVTINDLAEQSSLLPAGIATGETYEARLDYVAGPGAATITRNARHRIWGRIDRTSTAVRTDTTWAAALVMARDIVAHPLNAIAAAPGFAAAEPVARRSFDRASAWEELACEEMWQ